MAWQHDLTDQLQDSVCYVHQWEPCRGVQLVRPVATSTWRAVFLTLRLSCWGDVHVSLYVRRRCEVGHPVLSFCLSERLSEEFVWEDVAIGAFVCCALCVEMPDTWERRSHSDVSWKFPISPQSMHGQNIVYSLPPTVVGAGFGRRWSCRKAILFSSEFILGSFQPEAWFISRRLWTHDGFSPCPPRGGRLRCFLSVWNFSLPAMALILFIQLASCCAVPPRPDCSVK